jgi:hypothetical protein
MYKDVRHFLSNLPLRYYASGGLFRGDSPIMAFYLGENDAQALLARRNRPVGYEPSLKAEADIPPLPHSGSGYIRDYPRSRASHGFQPLTPKLAKRYGVNPNLEQLFVIDAGIKDVYFRLTTLHEVKRKTPEAAVEDLTEDPARLLDEWNDDRQYRWIVLGNDLRLEPVEQAAIDDQILLVGLVDDYCQDLESWSDSQRAWVHAIIPVPIAAFAYLTQVILKHESRVVIGIVATDSLAMSAVIRNGRLEVIRLYDGMDQALSGVEPTVDALKIENHFIYVWTAGAQLSAINLPGNAVALDASQLAAFGGSLLVPESHGKRLAHDEPVPHLLYWLSQQ